MVLPSTARSEAYGLVQLDAHGSGIPVVSTRLPTGVPWVNQGSQAERCVRGGSKRWFWVERQVDRLPGLMPDWFVVYSNWVQLTPDPGLDTMTVGPHLVIHVKDKAALKEALRPGDFNIPGI